MSASTATDRLTSPATGTSGGATTRRAGLLASPTTRRAATDLAVLAVLLATGVQAFGPVFGETVGYLAAGGGVVAGLVLAVVAAGRGWSKLGTLLAGMITFLVLGGPLALPGTTVAGVLPTLDTLQRLVLLTWQGWRDLLTVSLPAGEFDGPAVVPFLAALVTATLAGSLVLRLRRPQWALLPALALLLLGILWGSHDAPAALPQGLVFAATALAWSAWRSQIGGGSSQAHFVHTGPVSTTPLRHAGPAVAVLAGAVLLCVGVLNVTGSGEDRHVLRDDVVPPLDLRAYASPLTQFRYLELDQKNATLFTVSGLPDGARIRLATLDQYDGNVYNVTEGSARFGRAGDTILPSQFSDQSGSVLPLRFEIGDYSGVWLPGGGDLRGVRFDDPDGNAERRGLYYNPATGTTLTTAGVSEGSSYTVDVVLPRTWADTLDGLPADASPGAITFAPDTAEVEAASSVAADAIGDATTSLGQMGAMAAYLRTEGFYANGDTGHPSFAGHTVKRIGQLLTGDDTGQIVGDDEQYAVAMSLMSRTLGLPSRVVMGFYPAADAADSEPLAVTGDDAHVWVEVLFDDLGWVAFDPTPDEDKDPDKTTPKPQERNDPQVLPPPEVPEKREQRPPAKADSDTKDTEKKKDEKDPSSLPGYLLAAGGGAVLLVAPFALIVALKARRRRRRRNAPRLADRISGGWSEVVDAATDVGTPVPPYATRSETSQLLSEAHPTFDLDRIADRVDAHVFGGDDPTDADVTAVWTEVEHARKQLLHSLPLGRRLRARFSTRSLGRRSGGRKRATRRALATGAIA